MKQWIYDEAAALLLRQLLATYTPSSYELELSVFLSTYFSGFCDTVSVDVLGNVIAGINPDAPYRIMLSAHCDEVGLQITDISENGLLYFRRVGDIDPLSLYGHEVVILHGKERIDGVIGRAAQFSTYTERGLSFDVSDLWIDIGIDSYQEAAQIVCVGDFVSFKANFRKIGNTRFMSKGLDDKIGVFIISEAIKILRTRDITIGVYVVASTQEEIRTRGITVATCAVSPAVCFIVDVGFATDIPNKSINRGSLVLGNGSGIVYNADNNVLLTRHLVMIAEKNDIAIQKTVGLKLSGGTDAAVVQLTSTGVATASLSIPTRYMHGHTEICDVRDIESAVNLLVETILSIEKEQMFLFRPGID